MNGRERILLVWYTPFGLGGVETFTLHFAREAIARGAEVWVAATNQAIGPLKEKFEAIGANLVDWSCFADAFMDRVSQNPATQRIQHDLERIRPTLIILNDCNDFSIGAAPLLERVRNYATIIDVFHLDSPDAQYLGMRTHFAALLDGMVGTNRNVLSRFSAMVPMHASIPMVYIRQGVPTCVAEHASPTESLKLLYVGRLVQDQKRVLLLPDLFAQLRDRGRDFAVTLCGTGPQREELESMLAQRGLADRVRLAGYCPPSQVQELLLNHDALVNVSAFEGGFSMCVLEALAAGCVPTCTDHPSTDHDWMVNDRNCVLAPVDHPEALIDAWASLTPERIARLSAEARRTAQSLTSGICYERYLDFVAGLRGSRPLTPWPEVIHFNLEWDLSRHNPWLPNRSGWRGKFYSLRRNVMGR